MKYLLLVLIKLYQKTISIDHGFLGNFFPNTRVCIFIPTCSEYSYQAIKKYGTFIGIYLTIERISRCNPLNKGGIDNLKEIRLQGFAKLISQL